MKKSAFENVQTKIIQLCFKNKRNLVLLHKSNNRHTAAEMKTPVLWRNIVNYATTPILWENNVKSINSVYYLHICTKRTKLLYSKPESSILRRFLSLDAEYILNPILIFPGKNLNSLDKKYELWIFANFEAQRYLKQKFPSQVLSRL